MKKLVSSAVVVIGALRLKKRFNEGLYCLLFSQFFLDTLPGSQMDLFMY